MDTKALREQRAKLVADARQILDTAEAQARALSVEERDTIEKIDRDIDAIKATIEAREKLAAETYVVPESQREERTREEAKGDQRKIDYANAFDGYLRRGLAGLSSDERQVLSSGYQPFETREQNTLTGAAGGFVVAPDTRFYNQVVEARKAFGGMLSAGCTVIQTSTGADLPIPTNDDTGNTGAIVAEEGSHAGGTSISLGQVRLGAHLYSSKIVKISWQLLQDSEVDFPALLARKLGERIGRIQNTHMTTGTGAGQPQGVVTGATSGVAGATGTTTTIPADNLFDLFHSVDIAYRPNARWMMSDTTALALRKVKDGNGQYLWQPGLQMSAPDMLLGKPVVINNDMAVPAASAKSILFGDFSTYYIREVRALQVVRLEELYAANGQNGYMLFARLDAGLVDAGQHPIKYFAHSAS
jgi:HK97 family phage major capsid protein